MMRSSTAMIERLAQAGVRGLTCLAVLGLALAGCRNEAAGGGSVRLTLLAPEDGALPEHLELSAYNRVGRHANGRVPETGTLARAKRGELGTVVIFANPNDGPLGVHVFAPNADEAALQGALIVKLDPNRQVQETLRLARVPLSDADGDGVPDALDDCPQLPDPAQRGRDSDCTQPETPPDTPPGPPPPEGIANGATCVNSGDCKSGFCVDGVCCESACAAVCLSCALEGQEGRCVAAPAGQDPRDNCAASAQESCGSDGTCDGRGACRFHPTGTTCRPPACGSPATSITFAGTCDGAGACRPGAVGTCAPFTCLESACRETCAVDTDCAPGKFCVDGTCGRKPIGRACENAIDCASGHCVAGICCNQACTGGCQACNLAGSVGQCTAKPAGANSDGQCPTSASSSCGTSGVCNGAGGCAFHEAGLPCGLLCGDGVLADRACNGQGACVQTRTTSCLGYSCADKVCQLTCKTAEQCATTHDCKDGACVGRRPEGASCQQPDQCAVRHCTEHGVCCPKTCTGPGCAEAPTSECNARFGFECTAGGFYINDCCYETLSQLGFTGDHVVCGSRSLSVAAAFDFTQEPTRYHHGELRVDFPSEDLRAQTLRASVYLDGPPIKMNVNLVVITQGTNYRVVKGVPLAAGWNQIQAAITQEEAAATTGVALQFYLTRTGDIWAGRILVDEVDWR